ncbi:MAG: hypothetical protein ACRDJ9_22075, partial [Dehalococcoidia bacterium]
MNLPQLFQEAAEAIVDNTDWLVITPLRILMITLFALVVRWLAHRAIRRLVRSPLGAAPVLLRPLKERTPRLAEAAGLLTERRRQRAETIGSVLRNVASIT